MVDDVGLGPVAGPRLTGKGLGLLAFLIALMVVLVGLGPGPGPRDTREGFRVVSFPGCIHGCDHRVGPWPLGH